MSTFQYNASLLNSSQQLASNKGCQFSLPEVTVIMQSTITVLLLPYLAAALPANVWMIWLIVSGTKGSLAADIFLLNLAVCEIVHSVGAPLFLYCLYEIDAHPLVSKIHAEIEIFVWLGRPLFQCCICVERYLAVVHPLLFIRYKPLRFRGGCCGLMWFVVLFNISINSVWPLWSHLVTILLYCSTLLFIVLFCCLSVLWSLKRSGPRGKEWKKKEGEGLNGTKKRAFNIILVQLVCFVGNFLPSLMLTSLKDFLFPKIYYTLSGLLYLTVWFGLFQPLSYLRRAGKLTCAPAPTPRDISTGNS